MDFTDILKKIDANRRNFAANVERIRADKSLSDMGRAVKISRAYNAAAERHQALMGEYKAAKAEARQALLKDAFSPPSSSIEAFSAALVRADSIKDAHGLTRMIELAAVAGDKNSALAAAFRAYERGTYGVLDRFGEKFPAEAYFINKLFEFDVNHGEKMSHSARFDEKIQTTGPGRPPEYMNAVPPEDEAAGQ